MLKEGRKNREITARRLTTYEKVIKDRTKERESLSQDVQAIKNLYHKKETRVIYEYANIQD